MQIIQPAKGTLTARHGTGRIIFAAGRFALHVELAAEKTRLTKELEKIEAEIAKVEQKLANPDFVTKSSAAGFAGTSAAPCRVASKARPCRKPRLTRCKADFVLATKAAGAVNSAFVYFACCAVNFFAHGARTCHRHRHLHHRRVGCGGGVAGRAPAVAARVSGRRFRHRAARVSNGSPTCTPSQTISEIGLSLLLFMIGLEIDLKKMLSAGKVITLTAPARKSSAVCCSAGWCSDSPARRKTGWRRFISAWRRR